MACASCPTSERSEASQIGQDVPFQKDYFYFFKWLMIK